MLGSALLEIRLCPKLGSLQLGSPRLGLAWLGSARFDSVRLRSAGYSGFGSSRLLAQAQLGTPALGSGINSMFGSAQLGLSSNPRINSRLPTRDSSWLDSGLSSAHLDRSPARFISARLILARKFLYIVCVLLHRRNKCLTKADRIANAHTKNRGRKK